MLAGNYFIRYTFAAIGTAVVLPGIDGIGVGWFSTVSALFVAVSSAAVCCIVIFGTERNNKDAKSEQA